MTYQELKELVLAEDNGPAQYDVFFRKYPEFESAMQDRFIELCEEQKTTKWYISKQIGVNISVITRIYSKEAMMTASKLAAACYNVFHMSMQEFISGEKPPIDLPKNLSILVSSLDALEPEKRAKVLPQIKKKWLAWQMDAEPQEPFSALLLPERLKEVCADAYTDYYGPFVGGAPSRVFALSIMKLVDNDANDPAGKQFRFSQAVFMSIISDIPADYFLVRNYAKYLPVRYRSVSPMAPGKQIRKKLINDADILDTLSYILSVPSDVRGDMIGYALGQCWALTKKIPDVF